MASIYTRLKRAKVGKKLSSIELVEDYLTNLVAEADFKIVGETEALNSLETKIREIKKVKYRIVTIIGLAMCLQFAALKGVTFQISLAGIKLEHIQNIKELVVILFGAVSILYHLQNKELVKLQTLHKLIYIKKFGTEIFEILENTLPHSNISRGNIIDDFSIGYDFSVLRGIYLSISTFLYLGGLIALIGVVFWMFGAVAHDVWINPNLPLQWSRACVIFAVIAFAGDLVLSAGHGVVRYTYVNPADWDEFPFYKDGTKELSDEVVKFLEGEQKKRPIRRAFFRILSLLPRPAKK